MSDKKIGRDALASKKQSDNVVIWTLVFHS